MVSALLESGRKAAKGGVEHRPHQDGKRATPEFVVDEKFDIARPLFNWIKGPAVLHALKRAIEVFDQDLEIGPVERDATGKGLADDLVGDFHVRDQDRIAVFLGAASYSQRTA